MTCTTFDGAPLRIILDDTRPIHNGSTARIYKGVIHANEPLVVAVKLFGHMVDEVQTQLLVRELRVAQQISLRHPHILPFLGTADIGPETALVSPYMHNGNLLQYLKARPGVDKKALILQVAEAVHFLHAHVNLVHGDLKCDNVLVSDSGDALLADFGLNVFVEDTQSTLSTMTRVRNMNTLRFAAPELLLGPPSGAVRPRSKTRESDVYAFGMLLLQAVTEVAPWHGFNEVAVIMNACSGKHPPRPLAGGLVSMSHAMWDICLACWKMQPVNRPRMNDVLDVLKHVEIRPVKIVNPCGPVDAVAYMPDGSRIVSGSWTDGIRVWDVCTGRAIVGPMQGHTSPILCVATSSDGLAIASCSADETIRVWDARSGAAIVRPILADAAVKCVAYSPGGYYLASGEGSRVYLRDCTTGSAIGRQFHGHRFQVNAVAFSPDGSFVAAGADDGTIHIWDSASGGHIATLSTTQPDRAVHSLAFSPDGGRIAAGSRFRAIRIWNVFNPLLEMELDAAASKASTVAFSPSGNFVVGAGVGIIRLWDAGTGQLIGELPGANMFTGTAVAFSPDGRSLAACAQGVGILIWDLFD